MMPEMDGYEVCEKLRADERTKDVPIIFLTAKALKEDIIKGFEVGGQDYITKPFDARELMERVKTQLELKTQREILKNMNEVLEEKVKERTALLQEALSNLDKANQELQGLDTAKNNFLMMISHELRTPLNGIVGASYFLRDTLHEDKEFGEFVDMQKV
jgi:two-component system, sensor histidine kinase and response regulator